MTRLDFQYEAIGFGHKKSNACRHRVEESRIFHSKTEGLLSTMHHHEEKFQTEKIELLKSLSAMRIVTIYLFYISD